MSGIRGKGTVSVKKKKDALSRLASTGYKNLEFMHEANNGDTLISLQSLNTPASAVANGFAQPNAPDLAKVDLRYYKSNLILRSTSGMLTPFVDYKIAGAQTIELLRPALANEIFIGTLQSVARSGHTIVDAAPLVVTGTLLANETDFSVGPYEVGKYITQDHGSVLVIVDGVIVYRNNGNQDALSATTGDYQEVPNIIRFNVDVPTDRQVSVVSIGALVNRPQESFDALAETLQGQIDSMVPTLAALAGVAETEFQAAPNNTDLKAFGDKVLNHESRITALEADPVYYELHLDTGNGHGSVATKIRRFTNIRSNTLGSVATYADDASNGMSITINEAGAYELHYSDFYSAGTGSLGISLNAASLTANINDPGTTYAQGKRAIVNNAGANVSSGVTVTLNLIPGDIVRAHTNGVMDGATADVIFRMVKVR